MFLLEGEVKETRHKWRIKYEVTLSSLENLKFLRCESVVVAKSEADEKGACWSEVGKNGAACCSEVGKNGAACWSEVG